MNAAAVKTKSISIDQIRTDGGTQPRETIDRCVVDDYSRAIADLPPVVVYYDGSDYWLADGFHRLEAHVLTNAVFIDCEVRQGTVRDAILYSVSANANHGIRRTNADKRRSVLRLLNDEEWGKWSDRKIADQCGVSNSFVGDVRQESSVALQQMRMVDRGGKTFVAETAAKDDRKPRTLAAGKSPAVTFGEIDADNEPSARDEDEPRTRHGLPKTWNGRTIPDDAPPLNVKEVVDNDPAVRWMRLIADLGHVMAGLPKRDTLESLPARKREHIAGRLNDIAKQIREAVS